MEGRAGGQGGKIKFDLKGGTLRVEFDRSLWENRLVLAGFMFSGAAALIYEVTWTRALSLVLGSTMYAISTMLSTFMGGLALGAYVYGRYFDRNRNLLFGFALCEIGIGVSGLISIPLIYNLPSLYLFVYTRFHLYPPLFFFLQIMICVLVMIVPTILMGATFPLVSRKITSSMADMGNRVSMAYSLNTLGAVAGSLAAGFLLIPVIGLKGATAVAASLNIAVATVMLMLSGRTVLRPIMIGIPFLVLSTVWAVAAEHDSYLVNFHTASRSIAPGHAKSPDPDFHQVFHEESIEGEVRAFKTAQGMLLLQVGGKLEGTGLSDLPNTLLVAFLPIASHPMPTHVLNIGLGAGVTLAAARTAVPEVDLVEINPSVIRAVRDHGLPGLLDGVKIIHNDARNYLLRTEKFYDVISSEPSYPTESGVANLFTREYFEIAAARLTKNGVYAQWLPYHMLFDEGVLMMTKTFASVFPYTYVWKVSVTEDVILVGSRQPFLLTEREIRLRAADLNNLGYPLNFEVFMGPEDMPYLLQDEGVAINTDDKPLLEFLVVNNILLQCRFCGEGHPSTSALHSYLH